MATEGKKETIDGHLEDVPDTSAIEAVVRDIETATDAKAELAAEQVIPDVHPEAQDAGVETVLDTSAQELDEAARRVGGRLLGPEVHAGSVDGSGITIAPKKQVIVEKLFESRKNPGPASSSSTWEKLAGTRNNLLGLFRRSQAEKEAEKKLPKAA